MSVRLATAEINETGDAREPREFHPAPVLLVVEDDPDLREFLEIVLRSFDFEVLSAADGTEAEEICQRGGIDLVLMDIQMPMLDGPRILARLKRFDPEIACCFISGHLGRYTLDEIMSFGAIGLLQKPFGVKELRQLVKGAVA